MRASTERVSVARRRFLENGAIFAVFTKCIEGLEESRYLQEGFENAGWPVAWTAASPHDVAASTTLSQTRTPHIMLLRSLPLLLAAAGSAHALRDALPFFLLSTERYASYLHHLHSTT